MICLDNTKRKYYACFTLFALKLFTTIYYRMLNIMSLSSDCILSEVLVVVFESSVNMMLKDYGDCEWANPV